MKLLLVLADPLAFEEAYFARRLLQQLPPTVEALVVCQPMTAYVLIDDITRPESCPWPVLTWSAEAAERARLDSLTTAFAPDLVLVADPHGLVQTASPIPTDWPARFGVPVVALDTDGRRLDGPWQASLSATPPVTPDHASGWQPFDGMEGPLRRYMAREALIEQHRAHPASLIVLLPFSLPVQLLANVRLLGPWYQTMIDLVSWHLQSLGRPVLLLVTTPGCPQASEPRGQVQLVTYDDLIPPLLESTLAAADLLIVEQAWRFWRYQALAWGIPTATLANSLQMADGGLVSNFGKVDPALHPILDRLEAAAPHALVPFLNFPAPAEAWPSTAYAPEALWASLDLFDAAGSAAVLAALLSGQDQERWQSASAEFLNQGRGTKPVAQTLTRLAGAPQPR